MNPYQATKRRDKAERLAHHLFIAGISSEEAATKLTQPAWIGVASAAGVNAPSENTQAMVIEILKEKEKELQCRDSNR